MLTQEIKSLIEGQINSPRLTGVFFRVRLGQSMYNEEGYLTEFATACFAYWNGIKQAAKQAEFKATLQAEKVKHEAMMTENKTSTARAIKKSENKSRAAFIGSLRYDFRENIVIVSSVSKNFSNPVKMIRRYLKTIGINRIGKRLDFRTIEFSKAAFDEIFQYLTEKNKVNTTVPSSHGLLSKLIHVISCSIATSKEFVTGIGLLAIGNNYLNPVNNSNKPCYNIVLP